MYSENLPGPISKGQAVWAVQLVCLNLEEGTCKLYRNLVRIITLYWEKSQNNADIKDTATNTAKQCNLKHLYLLLKQWRSAVKIRYIVKFVTNIESNVVFAALIKCSVMFPAPVHMRPTLSVCILNKQIHSWLTVYFIILYLSLLHVSTPTRHPQAAFTRCLLSYLLYIPGRHSDNISTQTVCTSTWENFLELLRQ